MSAPAGTGDATVNIPMDPVNGHGYARSDSITPLRSKEVAGSPDSSGPYKRTHGHRVKIDPNAKKIGYDGEEDTLNRMGRIYNSILEFSIITRYFLYVTPLALCIAVPIIIGATVAQGARIGGSRLVWFFTWVEIVWLSLWGSKIVVHFLPAIFQILAGVVSSGTRKYALILRALNIPLSLVGWAIVSLVTFKRLMDIDHTGNGEWITIVQEILGACVAASLVLLVEKFFIQLISINYHRKQFNARIKESKRNIYIIGLLYEASRRLFPMYCNEFAEEDYAIADQLNLRKALGGSKGRSHNRSGSATPMRLLQDVGRFGDKVTSLFGNVAQEVTGKQVFNPNSAHSIVIEALEKRRTSEALARRIWMSFVIEGRESLSEADIADVLGQEHPEEADEAFAVLDRDGNGDVSLEEMVLTVTEIGRERKSIATSMHDVDQAITVLDRLLLTVVVVAVIFIFIAFLNKSFVTTLATAGTALLSLSFVFSVTAQEVLGSCIFLFVKHPFDIGDRVDINTDQLVVDHISLLFTVFRRVSGANVGRLVQIPNIVLNTLWIENVSRSKAMKEQLSLMIHFDTTFEDVQLLKNELLTFVQDKENSRDFQPDLEVQILGTSDLSKLELRVEIQHKSNWANETVRATRRSKFMCALVAALRRVPIYGPGGGGDALGSAANASYSVAISPEHAQSNKDAADNARNESRLVPKGSSNDESKYNNDNPLGLSQKQAGAINDLSSSNPAFDPVRDETLGHAREESGVLGDLPVIDRRDQDDIKGILRRESTRGRRKANSGDVQRLATGQSVGSQPPYIGSNDYARVSNEESPERYPYEVYSAPAGGSARAPQHLTPGYNPNAALPSVPGQPQRQPSNPYNRKSSSGQSAMSWKKGPYEEV
ncbi:hypothetical protein K461DRAFT_309435 [Myriangium duriaei CBS 260.36]|uniref:EF-hand domain-containing protein n=1 Tax=Myriangium duriaei CBS 260.36 TaxID=1168546 RepID=A0A9P4J8H8_9PEZI|nr:hypothetical protein K461DRAFT_309435 [Myriangium duriaei CBS 260.36]